MHDRPHHDRTPTTMDPLTDPAPAPATSLSAPTSAAPSTGADPAEAALAPPAALVSLHDADSLPAAPLSEPDDEFIDYDGDGAPSALPPAPISPPADVLGPSAPISARNSLSGTPASTQLLGSPPNALPGALSSRSMASMTSAAASASFSSAGGIASTGPMPPPPGGRRFSLLRSTSLRPRRASQSSTGSGTGSVKPLAVLPVDDPLPPLPSCPTSTVASPTVATNPAVPRPFGPSAALAAAAAAAGAKGSPFDKLVPNFVSKHIRDYVDQLVARGGPPLAIAAAAVANGGMARSPSLPPVTQETDEIGLREDGEDGGMIGSQETLAQSQAAAAAAAAAAHVVEKRSNPSQPPRRRSVAAGVPGTRPVSGMYPSSALASVRTSTSASPAAVAAAATAHDVVKQMSPVALEGWGAVVMCDVSGYSSLTSALADRGAEGTELMANIMKDFLDKIIQIISVHGGDIVKFVGDAVIFYWKHTEPSAAWLEDGEATIRRQHPNWDPEKVQECLDRALLQRRGRLVVQAAECCFDLLGKLKNYKVKIPMPGTGGGAVVLDGSITSGVTRSANGGVAMFEERELKIHLGIGAGKIYDIHVGGDPGRWEHFVVGDAMEQLAIVLDLAKPGQVALSKKAFEWFKHCVNLGRVHLESYDTKKCYIVNGLEPSAINYILPPGEANENNGFMDLWDVQLAGDPRPEGIDGYRQYINQSALFKLANDLQAASPFQLNQGVAHLMSLNELRQVTTVFIKIGSLSFAPVEAVEDAIKEQEGFINEQEENLVQIRRDILAARDTQVAPQATPDVVAEMESTIHDLKTQYADASTALAASRQVLKRLEADAKIALKDALARCQGAMTEVQVALKRHEGILRQFHVDDKGAVILAFFGLPPLAHKDDAVLGLRAAMEIVVEFRKLFEKFSVGVSTGVVSIGGVGNSLRTEYALMGDSINMAARLMGLPAAKNSLVCDERTYVLCMREFDFVDLGQAVVKGKANPINVYQPVRHRASPVSPDSSAGGAALGEAANAEDSINVRIRTRAPSGNVIALDGSGLEGNNMLIGRIKELGIVIGMLDRHVDGETGCSLVVEGESGIGVSTFGTMIQREAVKRNYNICVAPCVESEQATPYFPYRGIVRDLVQLLLNTASQLDNTGRFVPSSSVPPLGASSTRDLLDCAKQSIWALHSSTDSFRRPADVSTSHGSLGSPARPPQHNTEDRHSGSRLELGLAIAGASEWFQEAARAMLQIRGLTQAKCAHFLATVFPDEVQSGADTSMSTAVESMNAGGSSPFELANTLGALLNYATDRTRVMVLLSDVHFLDRPSWEVTRELMEACPRAVFVLLTRTVKHLSEADVAFFTSLQANATTIRLGGFTIPEMAQFMVLTLNRLLGVRSSPSGVLPHNGHHGTTTVASDPGETSTTTSATNANGLQVSSAAAPNSPRMIMAVDQRLVSKMHEISGGNPLFVSALIMTLRDKKCYDVSKTGVLSLNPMYKLDHIVPGSDLHSIIVSQFDRLDPMYQLFLKIASVLGQHFMVQDVLDFVEWEHVMDAKTTTPKAGLSSAPSNMPPSAAPAPVPLPPKPAMESASRLAETETMVGDIHAQDKFGFLVIPTTVMPNAMISFKNAVIRDSIYSTMLASQRQTLHLNFARFFENQLLASTSAATANGTGGHHSSTLQGATAGIPASSIHLVLKVFDHYSKVDGMLEKKLVYLEQVAHLKFAAHAVQEAIRHYEDLRALIATMAECEMLTKDDNTGLIMILGVDRVYTNFDQARWHKELGDAYLATRQPVLAETSLKMALTLLGYPLPERYLAQEWSAWIEYLRLQPPTAPALIQVAGAAGRKQVPLKPAPDSDLDRVFRVRSVFMSLAELYWSTDQLRKWSYLMWRAANLSSRAMPADPTTATLVALAGYTTYATKHNRSKSVKCIQWAVARHAALTAPVVAAESHAVVRTGSIVSVGSQRKASGPGGMTIADPNNPGRKLSGGLRPLTEGTAPAPAPTPLQAAHGIGHRSSIGLATFSAAPPEHGPVMSLEDQCLIHASAAAVGFLLGQIEAARNQCLQVAKMGNECNLAATIAARKLHLLMDLLLGNHTECKANASDMWTRCKDRSWEGRFFALAVIFLFDVTLKGSKLIQIDPPFALHVHELRQRALRMNAEPGALRTRMACVLMAWITLESGYWRTRQVSRTGGGGSGIAANGTSISVPSGATAQSSNPSAVATAAAAVATAAAAAATAAATPAHLPTSHQEIVGDAAAAARSATVALGDPMAALLAMLPTLTTNDYSCLIAIAGLLHLVATAYESDSLPFLAPRALLSKLLRAITQAVKRAFGTVAWAQWLAAFATGLDLVLAGRVLPACAMWDKVVANATATAAKPMAAPIINLTTSSAAVLAEATAAAPRTARTPNATVSATSFTAAGVTPWLVAVLTAKAKRYADAARGIAPFVVALATEPAPGPAAGAPGLSAPATGAVAALPATRFSSRSAPPDIARPGYLTSNRGAAVVYGQSLTLAGTSASSMPAALV
ncbi:hypothetical protein AMAG_15879 [Allomyces macrogynus ATCC 38327]|uniref:Guanylate cyclase domain-containing protein n=1 Tax=Allomyces macrogynus (strain ATCC 38327) TaxID=578462 RepID=A0A0L0T9J0_ALLM3|nr:hypothetical protein AMAG_15879 [Allomyces macrogynus ATCC 38327]|eukprot:KNE71224.1 hypothetical protein AMAG_15879 [Allomyces macrogynus ATCC 38327]